MANLIVEIGSRFFDVRSTTVVATRIAHYADPAGWPSYRLGFPS